MRPVLVSLLWLLWSLTCIAREPGRILVATAVWPPNFTVETGLGIYQQVLKQVYADYKVEFLFTTYARSKHLVREGKADLWLASYLAEEAWALYPVYPFDADLICVVRLPHSAWQGAQSLKHERVAWIAEYSFNQYLPELDMQAYEVPDLQVALRMLQAGRIGYVLDDWWNIQDHLGQHPAMQSELVLAPLALLRLYPGFQPTLQGRLLAEHWDVRLASMMDDGSLRAIFSSAGEPFLLERCPSGRQDDKQGPLCFVSDLQPAR
ncbi:substrate-binding periplasmic protein [Bowmanella dokdonensis]|uniref:Transporter substrate-binding domain-containing protein n=1 Tax=Bowmanella dokdonensis TaxID=751969 RepID=A0A939ISH1_9ALTE|nr:transporter substrate-binding domain-containing protein [Bowmanella dokdonensis]MBN7826426.1 transporter substrate-binding domain-containing protein [Bowmanella dokdonensis]